MFGVFEKAIIGMALLRLFSGTIEVLVAFLILKFNDVGKALILNSSLAIVGPLIMILTTTIGVYSIAEQVSYAKLIWIFIGICFIIYGVKS
ncbi:putative exporter of polyketide antibiotics [Salirhabdus euzebyi]|uniref:Putative exporter of polyketide antibiotics n=1 Tax=Salirhabdus euzebyi TaxID=394506 RepID=A0A841PU81_9BACI|nr:YqhV family protein [Salirhabdus euzebyi]MBB6452409.1 putative exporter of polyketide antibiotics [Salirhabdus euzebyi]